MKPSEIIKKRFYQSGNINENDEIYQFPAHFILIFLQYLDEQYETEKCRIEKLKRNLIPMD